VTDSRIEKRLRWLDDEIQPEVMTMNFTGTSSARSARSSSATAPSRRRFWFD
jgi:hypothetical protein